MPDTPNMRRIAQAAGVSKSAVSLALRDDPRMAKATRERIRRIAEELGYKKNNLVATLMSQLRSPDRVRFQGNLALFNCSPHARLFAWNTFRDFRDGIRVRAEHSGYGVEDFWVQEPGLKPERLHQILLARSISGIVLGAHLSLDPVIPGTEGLWQEFSLAVVGLARTRPPLPRATNNHYQTAKEAAEQVLALGYSRPALVIEPTVDELLDRRFSAGVDAGLRGLPRADRLAPPDFSLQDRAGFLRWYKRKRPDVVLTLHEQVRAWLEEAGVAIPSDVALVHLDRDPSHTDWAGMEQNNLEVGAAAADLVINQIHRRELGPREHPKLVLIDSDWVAGRTCPPRRAALAPLARTAVGS